MSKRRLFGHDTKQRRRIMGRAAPTKPRYRKRLRLDIPVGAPNSQRL
jgi:hypothetical protein